MGNTQKLHELLIKSMKQTEFYQEYSEALENFIFRMYTGSIGADEINQFIKMLLQAREPDEQEQQTNQNKD